jgi:hypothetical protein
MCKSVYNSSMDIHTENNKMRKSLAVDVKTYDLLQEICDMERRSKIDQLKVLIEKEHARLKSMILLQEKSTGLPLKVLDLLLRSNV